MSVDEAVNAVEREVKENPRLRIAAVSGPGEPLANPETFTLLGILRERGLNLKFCLSTNGTLLKESIPELVQLEASTISVSMSASTPQIASKIYEWARIDGEMLTGMKMGQRVIEKQLAGIEAAAQAGIIVKVNTILIPELNIDEIHSIAERVLISGASLQNVVPLVPAGNMSHYRSPTMIELTQARDRASSHITQFTHCKQCRSDVVGIPGRDRVL